MSCLDAGEVRYLTSERGGHRRGRAMWDKETWDSVLAFQLWQDDSGVKVMARARLSKMIGAYETAPTSTDSHQQQNGMNGQLGE